MSKIDNLCMACMGNKGDNKICPHCGYSDNEPQMEGALPLKYKLQDRYIVGKATDFNGEGIGYIGYDIVDDTPVYIREYMPSNLCSRDVDNVTVIAAKGSELSFKETEESFLNYNRRMASLRSLSSVVPIYDIFSENGTDYIIAEWVENITLNEFVERSGGRIDWNTARQLFMPVISALNELQRAGVHHFGITPENLIILRTGKMRLKGFCIPEVRCKDTDLKPDIYDGCAAIEQYTAGAKMDEYTDVYGLVSCLFFSLTGELPVSATKRKNDGRLMIPTAILKTLPSHIITALANGLQVKSTDRTQRLERLRDELSASPTVKMAVDDIATNQDGEISKNNNTDNKSKKIVSPLVWIAIIAVLLIGVSIVFYFIFFSSGNSDEDIINSLNSSFQSSSSSSSTSSLSSSSLSSSSGEISVPNLVGMSYDQAQQIANSQGNYQVLESSEEFSDTVKEGCIISQTPSFSATSKMSKGSIIAVVVSKGSSTRQLPNVSGMTLSQASSTLTSLGFVPQKGTEVYSNQFDEGIVIDYDSYEAGDYVKYGSTIRLTVSKGSSNSY